MRPGRRDVADLELERLEPAERPARESCDHVHPVAFGETGRKVRAAERDAIEDVTLAAEHQLGVAAVRGPDALHGQAEDGHEGFRVRGPARAETRQVPVQGVVHVGGREREVHGERPARILGDGRLRAARGTAPRTRPSDRPGARTRRRRRGRRGGRRRSSQASSAAARFSRPSPRHEARTTSPIIVPTIAGRPVSSARRPATRPTMPTGQGPRMIVAGAPAPPPTTTSGRRRVSAASPGRAPGPGPGARSPRVPRRSPCASGPGAACWRSRGPSPAPRLPPASRPAGGGRRPGPPPPARRR